MNDDAVRTIQALIDGEAEGEPPPFVHGMGIAESVVFTSVAKGSFTLEWLAEAHLCHADGIVQGGIVNVIADTGQSFAFWSTSERPETYSTADFETRFFRPIKAGETMMVRSEVVNRSRRLGVVHSTFVNKDTEKLHATVTGSWMLARRDF